jgi:hypothetical protein
VYTVLNFRGPTKAEERKLYNKNTLLSDTELWNISNEKERESNNIESKIDQIKFCRTDEGMTLTNGEGLKRI